MQLRAKVAAGGRGDKWQVVNDLITKASKIYVPADSSYLPMTMSAIHDMGLEDAEKTLHRLCCNFYVPSAWSMV
jgi:hypothetical protein